MFGSFLPSLWSLRNRSLLGSRSRDCYAIKAIGREPQIEPWLAIFATRTACRIRNRRRRHDGNVTLRKKRTPRASLHYMGWSAGQKSLLLPVAGEFFLLTLPFIERRNRKLA